MSESQSIARVVRPEQLAEQMNEDSYWLTALPGGAATSLDLRTDRGRKLFVEAQQKDCADWNERINKQLTITDVLLHPAFTTDPETGERKDFVRCVVFTKSGEMLDFGSFGVLKSLRLASILYGPPPWPDGITGILTQKQLSGNKRWVQIEWVTTANDLEKPRSQETGTPSKNRKP